jgi:hypothetical protein
MNNTKHKGEIVDQFEEDDNSSGSISRTDIKRNQMLPSLWNWKNRFFGRKDRKVYRFVEM